MTGTHTNAERREPVLGVAREVLQELLGLAKTSLEVLRDAACKRGLSAPLASLLGVLLELVGLLRHKVTHLVGGRLCIVEEVVGLLTRLPTMLGLQYILGELLDLLLVGDGVLVLKRHGQVGKE